MKTLLQEKIHIGSEVKRKRLREISKKDFSKCSASELYSLKYELTTIETFDLLLGILIITLVATIITTWNYDFLKEKSYFFYVVISIPILLSGAIAMIATFSVFDHKISCINHKKRLLSKINLEIKRHQLKEMQNKQPRVFIKFIIVGLIILGLWLISVWIFQSIRDPYLTYIALGLSILCMVTLLGGILYIIAFWQKFMPRNQKNNAECRRINH